MEVSREPSRLGQEGVEEVKHSYDIDLYEYEFLLTSALNVMTKEEFGSGASLLKKALQFCNDGFLESGRNADREGCTLGEDGAVRTPSDFPYWHDRFRETFGSAISGNPLDAGPHPSIRYSFLELLMGANAAYMTYFGFNAASIEMIERYGGIAMGHSIANELRLLNWSSCLCITEEEAGSDLSSLKTSAHKTSEDGVYQVVGRKRLISAGMHDLSENIIWFVLAVTNPDAGNAGLSCLAVPRYWPQADGTLDDNHVSCVDLPDKMGFRGCANPTLDFGAGGITKGYLVGTREGAGLLQLLTLMIQARVSTGIYALGIAAKAYREAVVYARRRIQGRSFQQTINWRLPALPIVEHPDVQRMLLSMKSRIDGGRALILELGRLQKAESDAIAANAASDGLGRLRRIIKVLTPLVKAYISDQAWNVCETAIQVLGGNGYLKTHVVEQCARDVKVLSIWEGTNFMQSQYLVREALGLGRSRDIISDLESLFTDVLRGPSASAQTSGMRNTFADAWSGWLSCVDRIAAHAEARRLNEIPKISTRFLELTAQLFISRFHILMADAAVREMAGGKSSDKLEFLEGKLQCATFWFANLSARFGSDVDFILRGADTYQVESRFIVF
jgi:acyl-CoA dehydrogenase